jgi:hypothetical protein
VRACVHGCCRRFEACLLWSSMCSPPLTLSTLLRLPPWPPQCVSFLMPGAAVKAKYEPLVTGEGVEQ